MDLTERLGFKADLDLKNGKIHFGELEPALVLERRLSDMSPVLAEPQERADNPLVHRIYRMIGDSPEIAASGLKFDITVILPGQFGREFPKTTGHYHLPVKDDVATPDFYQKVYGEGLIITQTENGHDVSAFVIEAPEMQHVLIPPWMGHLTVNKGDEPIVFANICVRAPHLNYEPFLRRRGAAFYQFHDRGPVPNPHYQNPQIGEMAPAQVLGLELDKMPFYPLLKGHNPQLEFLTLPQEHTALFNRCLTNNN